MNQVKSMSIPQPCHQSWQQMSVNAEGRHCDHCCKTVVDFTKMDDDEIIQYLSSATHTCGRFENYQLNGLNNYLATQSQRRFSWKSLAAGFSLLLTLQLAKAEAKPKYQTQQMPGNSKKNVKIVQADSALIIRIQGIVIDKSDRSPIPGASITIKGTPSGTITNVEGRFILNGKIGEVLVISFVGYETQEIVVKEHDQQINLELMMNSQVLGEPVITDYKRPSLPKRIWHKFKRLF